ncbi:IS21 family transposase [Acinetobacter baumannii]|uniref:IS21 family transposase n=2 Tax=Acinetobacter baumannii TaxID=470 RepID=UPI001CDBD2A3|nr:IS21 family transposase [Acinetobacter baumannii]MCA4250607.1 IS21 family transposase [Acinetobacter baumannii]MDW5356989.1 IS21 family transposase [Acinetobacter baumannii]
MRIETDKIRQIVRILNLGHSQRSTAIQARANRSSVKTIFDKLTLFPIDNSELNLFTNLELLDYFEISRTPTYPTRKIYPDFEYINQELKKRDMTLELLWQEYIAQYKEGLSYSRFCHVFNHFRNKKHASMRQTFKSGEVLLVDFCGRTMEITSPVDGSKSYAQVFVGVLGASAYTFAYAVPSQRVEHWLECFIKTFDHIGGVPATVITDNLKSAVLKNNKTGLIFQKDFEDFAAYYDFAIIPTRPRHPKDKGLAEVSVQIVQRAVLASLRNQKFFSIEELNQAIQEKMDVINRKTTRRFTISRYEQFLVLDSKDISPLPLYPYELCSWKRHVRVSEFYRVEYEGNQYSVPYTYIHLHVDLKVTQSAIHIFYEREKIAEHAISHGICLDICLDEHMSPAHRAQKGLSKDEIIHWANRAGPNTSHYVCHILNQKRDLARNIKSLNKLRKWVVDNQKSHCLEEACDFASQRQIYALDRLQRIIANSAYQIQQQPLSDALSHIPTSHHNIRGADYYLQNSGVAHA